MLQRIALTGSFDGNLHIGHISLLDRVKDIARNKCISIFIPHDSIIRNYKYREPIYTQEVRANNVSYLLQDVPHEVHLLTDCDITNLNLVSNLPNLSLYIFGEDQLHYRDTKYWNIKLKEELQNKKIEIRIIERTPNISTTQLLQQEMYA